jgi:23S rRNA pseudouridine2605 synthase
MAISNEKGEKVTKLLAACGHGSRRSCEELIDMLRVTINGRVAERGDRVKPGDEVRLDNSKLRAPQLQYFKAYKPKGFLCNETPTRQAPHVNDLLPRSKTRLFAVGRLDKDFEGLIIFTNDGELCNRLTHPRYQCPKKYEVRVTSSVPNSAVEKISKGIYLSEGKTAPIDIFIKRKSKERSILIMEIRENRRRLIPRVFAHLNLHVDKIKRISVGPVKLTGMSQGQVVRMDDKEIEILKKAAFQAKVKVLNKKKGKRMNLDQKSNKPYKKTPAKSPQNSKNPKTSKNPKNFKQKKKKKK